MRRFHHAAMFGTVVLTLATLCVGQNDCGARDPSSCPNSANSTNADQVALCNGPTAQQCPRYCCNCADPSLNNPCFCPGAGTCAVQSLSVAVATALPIGCGSVVGGNSSDGFSVVGSAAPELFYSFAVSATTTFPLFFDTCSLANFDTVIHLFNENAAVSIGTNNDHSGGCGNAGSTRSRLVVQDLPPGTYLVVVEGLQVGDSGTFLLSTTCGTPAPTDSPVAVPTSAPTTALMGALSQATPVDCNSAVRGNTVGLPSLGGLPSPELIYRINVTATTLMPLVLDTCSSTSFDTAIGVLDAAGTPTSFFNNDHGNTCGNVPGERSRLLFNPTSPGVYYVVVEGFEVNEVGTFTLNFACGTAAPSGVPSARPTNLPTLRPTQDPTHRPSEVPTSNPTAVPTTIPTHTPTEVPSVSPSRSPTATPTREPTEQPTGSPTAQPSPVPTFTPTTSPTPIPTALPTASPSKSPTSEPSAHPSASPTSSPSASPSRLPTAMPTSTPSAAPTTRLSHALATATAIGCGSSTFGDTTSGIQVLGNVSRDVFFRLTVTANSPLPVVLDTCALSNFDSILRVFDNAGTLQLVSNNDHGLTCPSAANPLASRLIFHPPRLGDYVIVVEGSESSQGQFILTTTCGTQAPTASPTGNPTGQPTSAPSAIPTGAPSAGPTSAPTTALSAALLRAPLIECGSTTLDNSTSGSTVLGESSPEKIYQFIVTANTELPIVFDTCALPRFDTIVRVLDVNGSQLTVNDNHTGLCGPTANGGLSHVVFFSPSNGVFYVVVEGSQTANGRFILSMLCGTNAPSAVPTLFPTTETTTTTTTTSTVTQERCTLNGRQLADDPDCAVVANSGTCPALVARDLCLLACGACTPGPRCNNVLDPSVCSLFSIADCTNGAELEPSRQISVADGCPAKCGNCPTTTSSTTVSTVTTSSTSTVTTQTQTTSTGTTTTTDPCRDSDFQLNLALRNHGYTYQGSSACDFFASTWADRVDRATWLCEGTTIVEQTTRLWCPRACQVGCGRQCYDREDLLTFAANRHFSSSGFVGLTCSTGAATLCTAQGNFGDVFRMLCPVSCNRCDQWFRFFDPTQAPSQNPTVAPSAAPSAQPSRTPSSSPTDLPSETPTHLPTTFPTPSPTSSSPTDHPTTSQPTGAPTSVPTLQPSEIPTASPTNSPTESLQTVMQRVALPISCGAQVSDNTASGTTVVGSLAPEKFYRFVVTTATSVPIVIDTCSGVSFDTVLRVFNSSGGELASNIGHSGQCTNTQSTFPSFLTFFPQTIGTFFVAIEGVAESIGEFTMSVTCGTTAPSSAPTDAPVVAPTSAPSNNPTQQPTVVPSSSPTSSAPTSFPTSVPTDVPSISPTTALSYALESATPIACGAVKLGNSSSGINVLGSPSADVFYRLSITSSTPLPIVIDTCLLVGFDTIVRLLDGSGREISLNDDHGGLCSGAADRLPSHLTVTPAPGVYYIVVEGFQTQQGSFNIAVTCGTGSPTLTPTQTPTRTAPPTPTARCTVGQDQCNACDSARACCVQCSNAKYVQDCVCVDTCRAGCTAVGNNLFDRSCVACPSLFTTPETSTASATVDSGLGGNTEESKSEGLPWLVLWIIIGVCVLFCCCIALCCCLYFRKERQKQAQVPPPAKSTYDNRAYSPPWAVQRVDTQAMASPTDSAGHPTRTQATSHPKVDPIRWDNPGTEPARSSLKLKTDTAEDLVMISDHSQVPSGESGWADYTEPSAIAPEAAVVSAPEPPRAPPPPPATQRTTAPPAKNIVRHPPTTQPPLRPPPSSPPPSGPPDQDTSPFPRLTLDSNSDDEEMPEFRDDDEVYNQVRELPDRSTHSDERRESSI